MALNWREIVAPQEGVKALFWDVFVLGLIGGALHKAYNSIPQEWKRTAFRKACLFLGWLLMMSVGAYCVSQIIIVTTNHLAARTVALAQKPPNLKMEGYFTALAAGPGDYAKDTFLIVALSLYNSGSPSIVKHWTMTITPPRGDLIHGRLVPNFPGSMPVPVGMSVPFFDPSSKTIESKDWLYDKVVKNPIGEGSMEQGFLMFVIPQTTVDYLRIPGTKAEISYFDSYDKEYKGILPLPEMSRE